MITTPEEYFKYLWGIEAQEPLLDEEGNIQYDENGEVIMVGVNPYNNRPILSIVLPSDERTFDVDLATRTISVPTFLSVQKDHRAETIYFLIDRFYEYKDLATTSCLIEYVNANGEGGYYLAPFYDITTYKSYTDANGNTYQDKMLIPWCIEGNVTKVAGPVQFALRFYELDKTNTEFVYNIRTKIATAEVLASTDESHLNANVDYDATANLIEQVNSKLDNAESTVYWTILPDTSIRSSYVHTTRDSSDQIDDYIDSLD